ncbi:1,4-alpha-glucan branching enzyme [Catalinimonas alkaloidigena]|uniref:1,4-alpha-glucan branching enzyme n=1 Tax=Catalinimonas alkaloidigena TaxID=1075417 RepID=A0A1G9SCL9_9BACT|nr:alpha-amylase family glycosyl hydrolase [Catalinimonas alkaloidigena]SDM33142.1 1,4-alpha-glucan branching enzyme [Catalinimonas alkaloidigena]
MIDLNEVGAHPQQDAHGQWQIRFGIYLPHITYAKGYGVKVRIIHAYDQFVRGIEPKDVWMNWQNGSAYDRWEVTVPLTVDLQSRFGQPGEYLYRFQLFRHAQEVTFWFADPFGRASGFGTLSSVTVDPAAVPFAWTDHAYQTPEVDRMVVYEVNVREFNRDFDGLVMQLDYLWDLGVNVLELMPISNVKEDVEWGYTPLGYFAPDERLGGPVGLKQLVDACHGRGMAVILDAVYAHAHPEFPYNLVYSTTGEPNPMMGVFEGEFFGNDKPGTDYRKTFTRDYFFALNRYYLAEYHVDGFRYDYVPGMYDGFLGQGYADLVYRTYQYSRQIPRFQADGRSRILQCAEHLPDPRQILAKTYSNAAWQNELLEAARGHRIDERLAHLLDPELVGYPSAYRNDMTGDTFPVAPFQYVESHDHERFLNTFGTLPQQDLLNESYGDRARFYQTQPYIIALYTGKGIPMLWQGQEFGENWGVPGDGIGRNLFERPLHWEYFYDAPGKALVRLYRKLGQLRRELPALSSRSYFYYYNNADHLHNQIIAYRRGVDDQGAGSVMIALNFSDQARQVWLPFPAVGTWTEQLEGTHPPLQVTHPDQWLPFSVPSHYGVVFRIA